MAKSAAASEAIFIDDLPLVDYLNALLSSAPPLNCDVFPQFFTPPPNHPYKTAVNHSIVVADKAEKKQVDELYRELELLRKENQQLRFESELSKIDVEVLRSENEKLTTVNSQYKSELIKNKAAVESLVAEKKRLKARITPLEAQIKELIEARNTARQRADIPQAVQSNTHNDATLTVEAIEKNNDQQPEQSIIPPEPDADMHASVPTPQKSPETIVLAQVSNQERNLFLSASENSDKPAAAPAEREIRLVSASSPNKQEMKTPQSTLHEVLAKVSVKSSKSSVKIIKPSKVAITDEIKPTAQTVTHKQVEIIAQPDTPSVPSIKQAPPIVEQIEELIPAVQQVHDQAEQAKALNPDDIELESVPTPKLVVRKNAQNYAQMQQEADQEKSSSDNQLRFFKLNAVT